MALQIELPPGELRRLRAQARLKALRGANEAAWESHPWPFLRDAVFTIDQQKGEEGGGVRKYPNPADVVCGCPDKCVNYYEHLVRTWWREKRLLVPKSRRLLISWTMIACHYWLARYRPHSSIAFAARKQGQHKAEGSAELVNRAWLIHQNLPAECAKREVRESWCRLVFDNGSEIVGIGEGADQARQYTYTAYLADEFAFWEHAGPTYGALLPTLEGGGRFTGVTTANPGFAEQLVFDTWHVGG